MARSIEVVVEDGESVASAVRRFKQKLHESAPGDPAVDRFQQLVEVKYTRGLTSAETAEMERLEAEFVEAEEAYYRPIIDRVKAHKRRAV